MGENSIFYRRNLPHYQPQEAIYSIVFRLAGSLPNEIIIKLMGERLSQEKLAKKLTDRNETIDGIRREYFFKFDAFLDSSATSPHWLRDDTIAGIISGAIHFLGTTRYTIIAYTIMPNHVHLIIVLREKATRNHSYRNMPYVLTKILHSLKRFTAREANKVLQRRGAFWQHESYDHVIRNSEELRKTVEYVINNPVAAKLATRWEDWRWTYLNKEWLEQNL
jgi:REP-associated tyrosine transposase